MRMQSLQKTLGCSTHSLQAGMVASCEAKLSWGHSFIKKSIAEALSLSPWRLQPNLMLPYGLQTGKALRSAAFLHTPLSRCATRTSKIERSAFSINERPREG